MTRMKSKEPAKQNVIPRDDVRKHKYFGPIDLNDWLDYTNSIVREVKKETKDKDEFLAFCKLKGLVITDPIVFLDIYWYGKRDRATYKKEYKEVKK